MYGESNENENTTIIGSLRRLGKCRGGTTVHSHCSPRDDRIKKRKKILDKNKPQEKNLAEMSIRDKN